MKKYFFILVFNFILLSVCFGQSIIINSIGMHKDGEPGNFQVVPGDVVKVSVNFTAIDIGSVEGTYFGSAVVDNMSKIRIFPYNELLPSGASTGSTTISIDINSFDWSLGTDQNTSFSFTLPNLPNKQSFQIALGLWGTDYNWDTFFGNRNTSYLSIGTTLPAAGTTTSGDYQSYMQISTDNTTEIPNLFNPSSPTITTYDNKTLLIDFQLSEAPLAGSAKLYFSTNPDGSTPNTTLTLTSPYHDTTRHQITFDASALTTASPHIAIVSGSRSLTHLTTYYVAIGYQDALGNAEAKSSWNKLVYDNEFPQPSWPTDYYSQSEDNVHLNFSIVEPTKGNVSVRIIPLNESNTRQFTLSMDNFNAGLNQVTIFGKNLSSTPGFSGWLGGIPGDNLVYGQDYSFQIELEDLAGNKTWSERSNPKKFFINHNVDITAVFTKAIHPLWENTTSGAENEFAELKISASGTCLLYGLNFTVSPSSISSDRITKFTVRDGNRWSKEFNYAPNSLYSISVTDNPFIIEENDPLYLKFYFEIDFADNGFDQYDYISMSISEDDINVTGTIVNYPANPVAVTRYLKQYLFVSHQNIQPVITNPERETPFFRLDLRTNDGEISLNNLLNFSVWGSITENDIADNQIHLYESTSPSLDLTNRSLLKSVPFGQEVSFSSLNREICPNTKYYYFTIKIADHFEPDTTILGNFNQESDLITTPTVANVLGFPLNTDTGDYMTLPVELSSFTAIFNISDGVGLNWVTESEINVSGFHIYRNEQDSFDGALRISTVLISNGVENGSQKIYTFNDDEVDLNTNYYYWLECVEFDGFSEFYGPFNVYTEHNLSEEGLNVGEPKSQLLSAYPNPFNPSVYIPYKLVENSSVEISIFNIKGQKVKSFFRDNQEPGNHSFYFNGKDSEGNVLSSGIYFYKMKAGKYSKTNKMILLK